MGKKTKQKGASNKPNKSNENDASPPVELIIPDNFNEVLYDFVNDLMIAFPEYNEKLLPWHSKELPEPVLKDIFSYMISVFPERFFDILYQNDDIFKEGGEANVCFLPGIDFRCFYHCEGISENNRNAIWKYLQLLLISILGSIKDKSNFGDAMGMFEGVDENVLHEKLSETISGISHFFKNLGMDEEVGSGSGNKNENGEANDGIPPNFEEDAKAFMENMEKQMPDFQETFEKMGGLGGGLGEGSGAGMGDMPRAEDIHEHLKGLFNGKIGSLAKELAEEISTDMEDMFGSGTDPNVRSTQDILKKMIKNPKKMMEIMKTIGNKLQQKMKSGEISEQDIMKEAGEIMGKMKGMGGKDSDFAEVFKNLAKTMGGGMGGGKAKMNMGALNQFTKNMAMKERLQTKLEQKRNQSQTSHEIDPNVSVLPKADGNLVFSVVGDDKQEKSFRRPLTASDLQDPPPSSFANTSFFVDKDIDTLATEIEGASKQKENGKNVSSKKKKV